MSNATCWTCPAGYSRGAAAPPSSCVKDDSVERQDGQSAPYFVHIDPRLQRIAILKKKKKKKEKNTDTGTSKSVSNAAAAAAASDTLERLGPLLATVRGGEDLILHGRGRRKLTPHNRSAILASLSSSSSSITSSSSPPTRASHDRYSFLSGTRLQVCGRGGVCVNASRGGVAPDGLSINVSLPHVADLWRGGAAAL